MLDNRQVYAIIPARGGSRGIPRKNLYRLGKDTLLERSIKLGQACPYVDQVLVSTDDPEMFEIAKRYQAQTPSLRPAHLATDSALTIDVILHVVGELHVQDSYILLLQVTSPLRTLADMNELFEMFERNIARADSIVSLTEEGFSHPNKIQKIENSYVTSYLGCESMVARQSLPKVYALNGAFYLTHSDVLIQRHSFFPERTLPFIMPGERSVNLDGKMDMILMEAMLEKGIVTLEEYD